MALGVQRDRSIDPAADAAREAATQTPSGRRYGRVAP